MVTTRRSISPDTVLFPASGVAASLQRAIAAATRPYPSRRVAERRIAPTARALAPSAIPLLTRKSVV